MLRPRYSLLTLLVLTALIAGGVKWWHGPHTVVERVSSDFELEYRYIRHWDSVSIPDGPCICRVIPAQKENAEIQVFYYRQGNQLLCSCELRQYTDLPDVMEPQIDCRQILSPAEQTEYERAIDQQKLRMPSIPGYKLHLIHKSIEFPRTLDDYRQRIGISFRF